MKRFICPNCFQLLREVELSYNNDYHCISCDGKLVKLDSQTESFLDYLNKLQLDVVIAHLKLMREEVLNKNLSYLKTNLSNFSNLSIEMFNGESVFGITLTQTIKTEINLDRSIL